jgi:hypothetical protein
MLQMSRNGVSDVIWLLNRRLGQRIKCRKSLADKIAPICVVCWVLRSACGRLSGLDDNRNSLV